MEKFINFKIIIEEKNFKNHLFSIISFIEFLVDYFFIFLRVKKLLC